MSSTNFVNGVTLTDADWFNDVDRVVYDILNDPDDINDVIASIGAVSFTGCVTYTAALTDPSGWLTCDGSAISRTTYSDLFAALVQSSAVTCSAASPGKVNWTSHGLQNYYPVKFTASGSLPTEITSGRVYWIKNKTANDFEISAYPGGTSINFSGTGSGITAVCAPFGDGNGTTTFNVPNLTDRVASTYGTLSFDVTFTGSDVNVSTEKITVPGNTNKLITGMPVVYTLVSGTAIGGLTSTNTYYIIRDSATTIKLAVSLNAAQIGTAINLTGTLSGTDSYKITYTGTVRGFGEDGGEEAHAMSDTELLAHVHPAPNGLRNLADGATASYDRVSGTSSSGSTGGNAAMNIMQPYLMMRAIIKT